MTEEVAGRGRAESEFRHEDITGDRAHCGVCPRRRQRFGGYEQGVQVWSPSLVCPNPNSHQSRNVDSRVASTPRDVHKRNEPRRGGNRSPFPSRVFPRRREGAPAASVTQYSSGGVHLALATIFKVLATRPCLPFRRRPGPATSPHNESRHHPTLPGQAPGCFLARLRGRPLSDYRPVIGCLKTLPVIHNRPDCRHRSVIDRLLRSVAHRPRCPKTRSGTR